MVFFLFALYYTSLGLCLTDLISDGGAQSYSSQTFGYWWPELYQYFPSNASNWYQKNMGTIQVKNRLDLPTTYGLELAVHYPVRICRRVSMKGNKKYKLSYDIFCMEKINQMYVIVQIDGTIVSSLFVPNENTFASRTDYINLQTDAPNAELCFSDTHNLLPAYLWDPNGIGYGAFLDNVSMLQSEVLDIRFTLAALQNISIFCLTSDSVYDQSRHLEFEKFYSLLISDKELDLLAFGSNADGYFQINGTFDFTFEDREIHFEIRSQNTDQMIFFNINIETSGVCYHHLSDGQKSALTQVHKAALTLTRYILTFCFFFRLGHSSYWIITLVNFQIISLLYVFLNIPSMPEFSKQVYHELVGIYFEVNSISNWLVKAGLVAHDTLRMQIEAEKVPEVIQEFEGNDLWLGHYGVSSLFINNNIDTLIFLVILFIKVIVLRLFSSCLGYANIKRVGAKISYTKLVLFQYSCNIPSIVLSATSRSTISTLSFFQSYQKSLQIIVNFLSLISAVYSITFFSKKRVLIPIIQKRVPRTKQRLKKWLNIKKALKIQLKLNGFDQKMPRQKQKKVFRTVRNRAEFKKKFVYCNLSDTLLLFTIPWLISMKSAKLFLVAHSILIVVKFAAYFHYTRNTKLRKHLVDFFINCTWVAHHVVFIMFYSLSNQEGLSQIRVQKSDFIVILGIMSISAIILGLILQSVKFLLNFFFSLKKFIQIVCKFKNVNFFQIKEQCRINPAQIRILKDQVKIELKQKNIRSIHQIQIENQQKKQILGKSRKIPKNIFYVRGGQRNKKVKF